MYCCVFFEAFFLILFSLSLSSYVMCHYILAIYIIWINLFHYIHQFISENLFHWYENIDKYEILSVQIFIFLYSISIACFNFFDFFEILHSIYLLLITILTLFHSSLQSTLISHSVSKWKLFVIILRCWEKQWEIWKVWKEWKRYIQWQCERSL